MSNIRAVGYTAAQELCNLVKEADNGKTNVDASNIGVNAATDNSVSWGEAIGGGAVAQNDKRLVMGKTVYTVKSSLEGDIATNTNAIAANTTAIETNTHDIASNKQSIEDNTADIAQNTGGISANSKRITNIEKLLQGNLYDYQTDTNSAYTKSVPSGAMPYAGLEQIGGKTVVWNQLLENTESTQTINDVTITNNGDGSWTVNGTASATVQGYVSGYLYFTQGHKYLLMGCPSGGGTTQYWLDIQNVAYETGQGIIINWTSANNRSKARICVYNGYSCNNLKFYPQFVDLTLMYGAGNEPSTVAEFESMFPASYYAYNAGTLLSAGVTEVISKGKNLADYSGGLGTPTPSSWNGNPRIIPLGYYYVGFTRNNYINRGDITYVAVTSNSITFKAASTYSGIGIPFSCMAGEKYTVKATVTNGIFRAGWYDYNGMFLIDTVSIASGGTVTAPANASLCLLVLCTTGDSANPATFTDIQVEHGETATSYSAPFTFDYPIPTAIRNIEGYGWSAGSVYNYVDFERKKFVKNVDKIVLNGTQSFALTNWRPQTNTVSWAYQFSVADVKTETLNILSVPLQAVSYWTIYGNDVPSIAARTNESYSMFVRVADTSLTTPTAINNYLSANPITVYYELATPQEIDISEYLTDDNLIQVESGGTLTFPNSNGTDYQIPVPSEETYMIDLQSALGE